MSGQFKAFVSEEQVQEERQKRQEEWDRVRKPDDPIECPEAETRSLFEQLQANKEYQERELEEETKLRSSVKGLDEDEVKFLDFVSQRQIQIEKDRNREEKAMLEELKISLFRQSIIITTFFLLKVQDKAKEKLTSADGAAALPAQAGSATTRSSQKQLLSGAIKRRSSDNKCETEEKYEPPDAKLMAGIPRNTRTPMVVAGILPGIADYADSDSSTENESNSSDSEEDHMIMPSVCTQRLIQDMMKKLKEEGCG
ncbi:unnamed protein product [Candidula unifasciata]|uniref:FAM192A/Fyv6 N-terminal domain-containing protein n=1 Tax=Candidula unifasciata TaxID=100452 RepID=A0A8S3YS13_9EUPU|nr:unnamed protein product [Candidula unifasciata]